MDIFPHQYFLPVLVEDSQEYLENITFLMILIVNLIFRQRLTEIKRWLFIGQETNIVKIIVTIEMKHGGVKNTSSNIPPQ